MKSNFTNEEIGKVVLNLNFCLNLNVRVNKAGNITVTNPLTYKNEKWTLYNTPDGLLWRRHNLITGYCYPLHMVNRNQLEYNKEYPKYSYWDMHKHCTFNSIDDAIIYFIKYFQRHEKNYTLSEKDLAFIKYKQRMGKY